MRDQKTNPWKTINRRLCYENDWIAVEHHDVINPSGNEGIYGIVHFKNIAIGIIPLDINNNTWLVGQYRYALDTYSWEIPMGGGNLSNDILVSAKRELEEETGITALSWKNIIELHTSNSVTDEKAVVFLARQLSFGQTNFDDTEDLTIRKISFDKVVQMVMNGEITDAISVAGILKLAHIIRTENE